MVFARGIGLGAALVASAALVGCSSGSGPASQAAPTTVLVPTTAAPTTAAPTTDLTVAGVGPGVMETPFYPTTTITSVTCGVAPGGMFVEVTIPGGAPPTPSRSALAESTTVVVVNNQAVLKDHTGKVLYRQSGTGDLAGRQGDFVLSMPSDTYIGGDDREVIVGAVNVEGNYVCPATNVPFPGL